MLWACSCFVWDCSGLALASFRGRSELSLASFGETRFGLLWACSAFVLGRSGFLRLRFGIALGFLAFISEYPRLALSYSGLALASFLGCSWLFSFWGTLWAHFGLLWARSGFVSSYSGITLRSDWGCSKLFLASLGGSSRLASKLLWTRLASFRGYAGFILRSLWVHFWVAMGLLWPRFGFAL